MVHFCIAGSPLNKLLQEREQNMSKQSIRAKFWFTIILISLLALLLFIAKLYCFKIYGENLLAEFTGVIVEVLIAVWILNYWKEHEEKKRLLAKEHRLREYLIFFLRHNFKKIPQEYRVRRMYGEDHKDNVQELDKLRDYIREHGLSAEAKTSIANHCKREISTLETLLPVAADITEEHFKRWARIVYFVNVASRQKDSIQDCTLNIISNIKRFDEASFKAELIGD